MARSRKTIEVKALKEEANRLLALPDHSDDFRKGIMIMIERILMDSNCYNGFNYLGWAKEGGYDRWVADGQPQDTTPYLGNETRRFYY